MKKFLSLVLALVMTMSLVTVSAGAKDFNDSDDLSGEQYEEAVNVMSEMGIIDGYAGGNFQPQGTLTRGAAAKIIACMMLGKTTAEALGTSAAPFKDVPAGSTFAGYIAYCVESGLIDGYADGTFRPQNTLTGFAFLKMLLTALGYDSTIEGYTGPNWTVNVMGRAQQEGLTTGDDEFVGSRALTREEACLFAVNTLRATLVEYDSKGTNVTVNGATVAIGASKPTYVTSSISGAATAIDDTKDNTQHDYTVEFAEKYQPDLKLVRDADDFDRPARTWNWKGRDIGTYVDLEKLVAEYTTAVTGEELYDLLTKSIIDDYTVEYYVDGQADDTIKNSNMIRSNDTEYETTGNGVLTQVFVDHDEKLVTITSINTYLAKATADYNERRGTLTVEIYAYDTSVGDPTKAKTYTETIDVDDVPAVADYKEGDYMMINWAETSRGNYPSNMDVIVVSEPEVMSDSSVNKFSENKYLVTGGNEYDYADKGTSKNDLNTYYDDLLDNTYDIYLDAYGYVLGTVKVDGDLKYLFLTGYDKAASHLSVRTATGAAIFLDGSFEEIQIDVKDTNGYLDAYQAKHGDTFYKDLDEGDNQYNKWFTYSTDTKNGSTVYTLTPVDNWMDISAPSDPVQNGEVEKINPASVRLDREVGTGRGTVAYGNDDSVYVTVDTGDVSDNQGGSADDFAITDVDGVYTGVQSVDLVLDDDNKNKLSNIDNQAKNTDNSPAIFAVYDDDRYIIGAVVVGEDENNTKNYAYALKSAQNEYKDDEGNYFWDFEAVVDGEIVTLTVKEEGRPVLRDRVDSWIGLSTFSMLEVTYDADGYVVDVARCVDNADTSGYELDEDDDVYSNTEFINKDSLRDYKVYDIALDGALDEYLMAVGNTLYVEGYTGYDRGLTIAADAPVILVQQDTAGRWIINDYTTIKQALDALEDADYNEPEVQFEGHVAAVLNSNTTAQYLVIKSETLVPVEDDDHSMPNRNLDDVNIAWDGFGPNNFWVNLLDRNDQKVNSGSFEYKLYVRQSGQASFDIAETGVITAAQAQAGAFKTNVPNGSSWYIVVNGITSNVITQGI